MLQSSPTEALGAAKEFVATDEDVPLRRLPSCGCIGRCLSPGGPEAIAKGRQACFSGLRKRPVQTEKKR